MTGHYWNYGVIALKPIKHVGDYLNSVVQWIYSLCLKLPVRGLNHSVNKNTGMQVRLADESQIE